MTKPGARVLGVTRKAAGSLGAATVGLLFIAESVVAQSYTSLEACRLDDVLAESECSRLYGPDGVYTSSGISTAAIVGIVAAVVAVVLIGIALVIRHRRRTRNADPETPTSPVAAQAQPPEPQPSVAAPFPVGRPPESLPSVAGPIEVNRAGVGIAIFGAALLVIALFLPRVESSKFFVVEDNTLVASGDWLGLLISCSVVAVVAAVRVIQQREHDWVVAIAGAAALGLVIYNATGERMELVGQSRFNSSVTETASPAVGIYAAGIASALMIVGGLILAGRGTGLFFLGREPEPVRKFKTCPDCAETVLAEARVCKHCGYRLDAPSAG